MRPAAPMAMVVVRMAGRAIHRGRRGRVPNALPEGRVSKLRGEAM